MLRGVSMKNKQGQNVQDRIKQDIEYAESKENISDRMLLATKALGAADLAVEFQLITYKEWETYIDRIFKML
jgi:hypothetical protein